MDALPPDVEWAVSKFIEAPFVVESKADSNLLNGFILSLRKAEEKIGKKIDINQSSEDITEKEYKDIINKVNKRIMEEIKTDDMIIKVIDRTDKSSEKDISDMKEFIVKERKKQFEEVALKKWDPFAWVDEGIGGKRVCVVFPFKSVKGLTEILKETIPSETVKLGDMTAAQMFEFTTWHELGHCLLGTSEAKADAFGMLMTIKENKSKDIVKNIAVWREGMELAGEYIIDNHLSSKILWKIEKLKEGLEKSLAFKNANTEDIAYMANKIAERYDFTQGEKHYIVMSKAMFGEGSKRKYHYLKDPESKKVKSVNFIDWIDGNKDIENIGRFIEIKKYWGSDVKKMQENNMDASKLYESVISKINVGNPTVKVMMEAMIKAPNGPIADVQVRGWRSPFDFNFEKDIDKSLALIEDIKNENGNRLGR